MALDCKLTNGRGLSCKDAIGGIQAVYFINNDTATFETDSPDYTEITKMDDGDTTTPAAVDVFKYAVEGTGNSFTWKTVSSRDNGTTYVEQTLNLSLLKLDKESNKQIKMLAYGRPQVIVHDYQGNAWLMGFLKGADLQDATAETGDAMGDKNGYTLVLMANEKFAPLAITGSTYEDPFASTDIMANVIPPGTVTP
jgi:hypothetical protein